MDRRVGYIIGGAFVLGLFLWIFFSIRGLMNQGRAVYIYNPLEVKLNIDIGDDHYELSPNKLKEIEITEGKHTVKSKLTNDVILDTFIRISSDFLEKGGLINLSGEPMYEWAEYYGSPGIESIYDLGDDSTGSVQSPLEQSRTQSSELFRIDSTWLYGVIKEYKANELVITKTWDYNIDEDFEDEIPAGDSYVGLGSSATKLFDKKGMLAYWFENYGDILDAETE